MESQTYFKNLRITPRKYRDVVRTVRGMNPVEAANVLSTMNKKAAASLTKVIRSAIANAKSALKVTDDMLEFRLFTVEEGQKLKRFRPTSRGMAKSFLRRSSHIKIVLVPRKAEEVSVEEKPAKKAAPKAAGKKESVKAPAKVEQKQEAKAVTKSEEKKTDK
jgi:large subunit ribosomal protein L22